MQLKWGTVVAIKRVSRANGSQQAPIKTGGEGKAAGGKRSPKSPKACPELPLLGQRSSWAAGNQAEPFSQHLWMWWEGRDLPRITWWSLKRWNPAVPWVGVRFWGNWDALPGARWDPWKEKQLVGGDPQNPRVCPEQPLLGADPCGVRGSDGKGRICLESPGGA